MIRERVKSGIPGGLMLVALLCVGGGVAWCMANSEPPIKIAAGVMGLIAVVCVGGFFVVDPNEARVLQLFGRYAGTVKEAGLHWANPFYTKRRLTLRAISFESQRLKVNDLDGNPI